VDQKYSSTVDWESRVDESVFILSVYRGNIPPKSLTPPQKKTPNIFVFRPEIFSVVSCYFCLFMYLQYVLKLVSYSN